ncbi:DMT family transporter [Oceanithermus sp.]
MSYRPPAGLVVGVVAVGVMAVSAAAIFVRYGFVAAGSSAPGLALLLAALRLTMAALLLAPTWRGLLRARVQPGALGLAALAGVFLGIHFGTWITSLAYTSVAASVTIVTSNPIWVALFGWLWLGEKLDRRTLAGVLIAAVGGVLIGLGDAGGDSAGSAPLLGDGLALVGAWAVSGYFLLGREAQRRGLSVGQYAALAYATAALTLLPLPLLFGTPYTGWPWGVYGAALGMALFSQLVGHTSFNWAIRYVSPVLVTLAILFEPLGSGLLAYLFFAEVPPRLVFVGAAVLIAGVGLAVSGRHG